jgi:16S rRNA processing protein RimM
MKRYIEAAKITSTHGLKGECKVQCLLDSIDVLDSLDVLYLKSGAKPLEIQSLRPHKNGAILKFFDIDRIEDIQPYIGQVLYADRNDIPLPENTWFIQDLIGLTVKDADTGEVYGVVKDISSFGAADVYTIRNDEGKERMFPSIPEVLIDTNIEEGVILIRPLPGLFEDEVE